ncbi:hypothetical protein BEH94_06710 [Candidatus Altiarchaeales archaeon WOR_SM1_SCG]|nr:hypothetical protein BEH94_06710 [Candidatus Altiarchaeales archaeon WOR_SM1_SCG]
MKYYLYNEGKTEEEVRKFISEYEKGVRIPASRYMRILKHVPKNTYALDYGCGWGQFSKFMREKGCKVDGIDLSQNAINIANLVYSGDENLKFEVKNIREIKDEKYDVVVSNEVIEHTHNPGNYVKECNRVLRDGGILIISLPNIITPKFFLSTLVYNHEKFKKLNRDMLNDYDKAHHHIQAWDPETFCRFLSTLGFEYIDHEFMEGLPFPYCNYWRFGSKIPLLKNLSYTMMFKMKKMKFVEIKNCD